MGRSILVTGGATGLGRAIALYLAKKNYSVVIHYRTSIEKAEEVADLCRQSGVDAATLQGDFSACCSTQEFISRYQKLFPQTYALINNVGPYLIAPLSQTSDKDWDRIFQGNLYAPFFLSRDLPTERIINIGCPGLPSRRANTYCAAYRIAKAALWEMTLSFAKEYAPRTTVNMVSPGILENSIDRAEWKNQEPIQLAEVARVVAFLLEKDNHHITGQNIEIAAGFGL